jgi:hypothetical protein
MTRIQGIEQTYYTVIQTWKEYVDPGTAVRRLLLPSFEHSNIAIRIMYVEFLATHHAQQIDGGPFVPSQSYIHQSSQVTQSILHGLSLGFLPLLFLSLCTLFRCLVLTPPVSKHTRSKYHSNIGTEKYQACEPFRKRVEYVKCCLGSWTIKCIRASRENRVPSRPMVHDRKSVYRNGGLER